MQRDSYRIQMEKVEYCNVSHVRFVHDSTEEKNVSVFPPSSRTLYVRITKHRMYRHYEVHKRFFIGRQSPSVENSDNKYFFFRLPDRRNQGFDRN